MSRLDKLDYAADFLRGWPNEGALESSIYPMADPYDAATNPGGDVIEAGDLVELNANSQVIPNVSETNHAAIVVRGNNDDKSVVAAGNKPILLWSGYIVRTTKFNSTNVNAVGMKVNAVGGVFDIATITAATTDNYLGTVLELGSATYNGVSTPYAVILVK